MPDRPPATTAPPETVGARSAVPGAGGVNRVFADESACPCSPIIPQIVIKAVTAELHRVTRLATLHPFCAGLRPGLPVLTLSLLPVDLVVIVMFLALPVT